MSSTQQLLLGEGAGGSGPANYIEDVFSTYLYTGNGSSQTITNGIDLSGKGGMVWIKSRSNAKSNSLFDTERGAYKWLTSNGTNASTNFSPNSLTAFNSNGFSLLDDATSTYAVNGTNYTYASWTFRKQPKFFDVVTYTGDGNSGRSISHNLGSTPGCVIIKRTDTTSNWITWHRGATSVTYPYLKLNTTAAVDSYSESLTPTSTTFIAGSSGASLDDMNASGGTYVAYLFAHDAGGFGLTGTDNVISCGSVTANGSGAATINLGYEPQWIMFKNITNADSWYIFDNMRGLFAPTQLSPTLRANIANAEVNSGSSPRPSATGVSWTAGDTVLTASNTYIYIAIRRGPMKVPTSGTSVFSPNTFSAAGTFITTNFVVDAALSNVRAGNANNTLMVDRLRGATSSLVTSSTAAETTAISVDSFTYNNGYLDDALSGSQISYAFRRSPSFFDEVCYTGTGSATTQTHNLQAIPELIIVKKRNVDSTTNWYVYSAALGNTQVGILSGTNAFFTSSSYWNNTTPTSSVFSLGSGSNVNQSGTLFVSYLFATAAGVSKVGSYTGTATTKQIDCGFTGGARFVLIKRTDASGDWYVWDSARGIVAGNDPYLLLNSTAAEVTGTDYVDTYSAGFEISSTAPAAINANGGTFIFLAIA